MCSFIQPLIHPFLHSITMSCPPALRPGIMLVVLKLQKGKCHGPLLLLNSNFSGRRIHQRRYIFFKWCKKHNDRTMYKEEWKDAEAVKLSPSQRCTVLGGKGHPLQQTLFSISILWAHLSSPVSMGSASMWTASQCQAGHSLLLRTFPSTVATQKGRVVCT